MVQRIVEAYAEGRLIASIAISLDAVGPLTREFDFINVAKEKMTGFSPDQVDQWVVREPQSGAPEEQEGEP